MNPTDRVRLDGRVAVVTGAGSGLGRAVAQILGAAGATVACADLDGEAAEATATGIVAVGGAALAFGADVSKRSSVQSMIAGVVAEVGTVDVMCNIAGIPGDQAELAEVVETSFDRIIAVHVKGTLFCCQAVIPVMRSAGGGSIINMSSTAIDTPSARLGAYTIAKAAIAELTKVLAVEVGPAHIRVNAVAPGFVDTPLATRALDDDGERERFFASMAGMSPLGRVGRTDDVADSFLYLASDLSAFVTGQTLRPNGGASMPW